MAAKPSYRQRLHAIWRTLLTACESGEAPKGYYGPETCRLATAAECAELGLPALAVIHFNDAGTVDCAFTETGMVLSPHLDR